MGDLTMMLTADQKALYEGEGGKAAALAMRIVSNLGMIQQAPRLIPIAAAHVDSCLYHGRSSLDFVDTLRRGSGQVSVPTTLNVGGLDMMRPERFLGSARQSAESRQLMEGYVELGCTPTFTCAPYQLPGRPPQGADVAWAESNAIAFGNSVIGLRTNRYGDLVDICAAIVGSVPYTGLHVAENRLATVVFEIDEQLSRGWSKDLLPALLGHHVGRQAYGDVPVLDGLASHDVSEDWCKAFGAAAASSGGVAMYHIVGITPEASTLDVATGGRVPRRVRVHHEDLEHARQQLTTVDATAVLGGVTLGTPHLSQAEFRELAELFDGRVTAVPAFASTSRHVIASESKAAATLEAAGVSLVSDTCTYVSPIMGDLGVVMTNSAKWAYYAPANLGIDVVLASRAECVQSAVAGRIILGDPR